MRKILLSLLTVSAVAVVAVVATGAFFSDTETSAGNTFVAGSVDLLVDNNCTYNGQPCPEPTGIETSWDETDLGVQHKFFNFTDVKPGDQGEDTISLHVVDNDAWACLTIDNFTNDDNSCTEPEGDLLDGNDTTCGPNEGELADNLHFFAWLDQGTIPGFGDTETDEGDNDWQGQATEPMLFTNVSGPASDILDGITYPLADSQNPVIDTFLVGSTTYYIGVYWCAGTLGVADGDLTCDGNGMGNDTQTDSLTADMTFYAEQWRNNPTFTCED